MTEFNLTNVDHKMIEKTANAITIDIKEMMSIGVILSGSTLETLNHFWEGPAKENFEKQLSSFLLGYNKLVDSYENLNEQLIEAGKKYEHADDTAKQLIRKMEK